VDCSPCGATTPRSRQPVRPRPAEEAAPRPRLHRAVFAPNSIDGPFGPPAPRSCRTPTPVADLQRHRPIPSPAPPPTLTGRRYANAARQQSADTSSTVTVRSPPATPCHHKPTARVRAMQHPHVASVSRRPSSPDALRILHTVRHGDRAHRANRFRAEKVVPITSLEPVHSGPSRSPCPARYNKYPNRDGPASRTGRLDHSLDFNPLEISVPVPAFLLLVRPSRAHATVA